MSKLRKKMAMINKTASTLDDIVTDVKQVTDEITDAVNYAKEAIKFMDIIDGDTPIIGYFQERVIDKLEAILQDDIFKMINEEVAKEKQYDY